MDTGTLRAFVAVAAAGRFTSAAKQLGVTQPSLSRRVQQLEREAGARLLVRTPDGVVLTSAGRRFLTHAQRALAAVEAGLTEVDELSGKPRGVVTIGTMPTVGAYALPDVLARYAALHPDVVLRLREGMTDQLEEQVARGDLDLAVLNLPVRRLDLAARKLWQEDYLLAVPLGHRLAASVVPVALAEVSGEALVVVPGTPSTSALEAACEERGVRPRVVVEADNLESVRRMVERGVGLALLPRIMLRDERPRGFAALEVGAGGVRRQVAVIHRGEGYLTAAARALRSMLIESLGAGPRAGAKKRGATKSPPAGSPPGA